MSAHHSIVFPTAQHEGWQALRSRSGFLPTLAGRHLARRLSIRCGGALLSHRFKSSEQLPSNVVIANHKETVLCRFISPRARLIPPRARQVT